MFINARRSLAAVAASLVTSVLLVWIDYALDVERLRVALAS